MYQLNAPTASAGRLPELANDELTTLLHLLGDEEVAELVAELDANVAARLGL